MACQLAIQVAAFSCLCWTSFSTTVARPIPVRFLRRSGNGRIKESRDVLPGLTGVQRRSAVIIRYLGSGSTELAEVSPGKGTAWRSLVSSPLRRFLF
jgi:hypothetical protein